MACVDLQMFLLCLSTSMNGTNVTYPGFGTFTDMDFYDAKYRPVIALPDSPDRMDLNFSLYTRSNRNVPDMIKYNKTFMMKNSHFERKHGTKIIVHGFLDNNVVPADWMVVMKDRFLSADIPYNVIIVDWSDGNFLPYTQAVANARIVGIMIGMMIENLCRTFRISERSFHLLGHSLGAHVVAYAGKYHRGKLGQITGFDPAGPLFEGLTNHSARLWHTDARFVDVIHTDTGDLLQDFGLGMTEPCGHRDIYPNGGRTQPGCDQERFTSVVTHGLYEGVRRLVACNHNRVVEFYLESINQRQNRRRRTIPVPIAFECLDYETFQAGHCTDCGPDGTRCAILGPDQQDPNRHRKPGKKFFMVTGDSPRYFRFQYVVTVRISVNESSLNDDAIAEGTITFSFNDRRTKRQEVVLFNEKSQKFRPGAEYRRVLALDLDPEKPPSKMEFQWSTNEYFSWSPSARMSVECLEFRYLIPTTKRRNKPSSLSTFLFKPAKNNRIINNAEKAIFVRDQ